jgi:hypothetical protein
MCGTRSRITTIWRRHCIPWCTGHGCPGDRRHLGLVSDARFRVHSFCRANSSQVGVCRRLLQAWRVGMRAGVITDEVEMLSVRGRDAKRLFHQPIWLIPVAVRPFFGVHFAVIATISSTVRSLSSSRCDWWRKPAAASLALHLSVGQKTA